MPTTLQCMEIPLREGNVRFSNLDKYILLKEIDYPLTVPITSDEICGVTAMVLGRTYDMGTYTTRSSSSRRFREATKRLLNGGILEIYGDNKVRIKRR